jgi:hypothetical protein
MVGKNAINKVFKCFSIIFIVMSEEDSTYFYGVPGEEYTVKREENTPGIMKKYEKSWLPFTRTHLEEVKYASEELNLGPRWRKLGYLATGRPLISDALMLPFTAFCKLKDKISRKQPISSSFSNMISKKSKLVGSHG